VARSLLLACALLAPSGTAQEPRAVERRFGTELELSTATFELVGSEDGHRVEQRAPRYVREQADEVELEDTLLDDGAPPAKFTRHYRTVATAFRIGAENAPREKTAAAGLEGRTVTFEREPGGTYARTCADEDVRPALLRRLRQDLSLACFLPPEEDEESGPGSRWEFPSAHLLRLIAPLEEGVRRPRKRPAGPPGGLNFAPAALGEPLASLFDAAAGDSSATLLAPTEDDELPRNARLEFRLTSAYDGAETLLAGLMGDADAEAEDEVQLVYEGDGTLSWDPESGQVELVCRGELRLSESFSVSLEANGKRGVVEGKLELVGSLELEAREEPQE
jgi:hypothetical protein